MTFFFYDTIKVVGIFVRIAYIYFFFPYIYGVPGVTFDVFTLLSQSVSRYGYEAKTSVPHIDFYFLNFPKESQLN